MDYICFLEKVSLYSTFLPVIIGLVCIRALRMPWLLLLPYFILTLGLDFWADHLSENVVNNMFILHLHTPLEFVCVGIMYYYFLAGSWTKRIVVIVIPAFVLFCLINALFIQDIDEVNSIPRGLESPMLIIGSLTLYNQMLKRLETIILERDPVFWMNSGILLYFAGTFFLSIFSSQILKLENAQYWIIHSILNIMFNIFMSMGMWLSIRK